MKTRFVITLVLIFLIGLTSSVFAKTSALLIGIDEYPGLTKNRWLSNASRNGVRMMKELLTKRFHISDIDTLINKQATRDEIIDSIKSYEGKLSSSDVLLIYYTGHGTTVISKNNDERLDDAIVCYNFGFAPNATLQVSPKNIIIDDEIGKMIDKIKANNGPKVVFIADTCHSGTMTKGAGDEDQINTSDRLVMGIENIRWPWGDRTESRNSVLISTSKQSADVVISACLDSQEANAMRMIPDGYVGLLTYYLVSELSNPRKDITYFTLGNTLKRRIRELVTQQTPQVVGKYSDIFLDTHDNLKYARRGTNDTATKVFLDGFDGEDTSDIESVIDNTNEFVTLVNALDGIGKDTLIFKYKASDDYASSGDISASMSIGLGKSQKEIWQTPSAKEAIELGNRLYCYAALGRAIKDPGGLLSASSSKLEPQLTLDDSAAPYASLWPKVKNDFQYVLQISDEAASSRIRYKLNVNHDCYGFIIAIDQKGDPEIITPDGSDPLVFKAGDLEIPIESQVDSQTVKGYKVFPGRYVFATIVFESQDAAAAALRSFKQGYALPVSVKSGEASYLLVDIEK